MENEYNNVQVVQDLYAALRRGDAALLNSLLDEEVSWRFVGPPEEIPFAGNHHGRRQALAAFDAFVEACEVHEFGPNEIMTFGEHVLSIGWSCVRVRATGRMYETDWAHLFTVRRERIVRVQEFADTATIAEAFRA